MARMSPFETFLVNRLKGRANARLFAALRGALALPPGASCLEIGCGKGDMALRLLEAYRPRTYVATDYDPAQIERAGDFAKRTRGAIPEALDLRTADALDLPFPDASFDAVFAFAVLHHVEDHFWRYEKIPRALKEMARVVRPGGSLAYEEWVHKPRIRDDLSRDGFRIKLRRRIHLGLAEVVVATKAARP